MSISSPGLGTSGPTTATHGQLLRNAIADRASISFMGIYDVFSATVAARHYDALFVSGFSFAASYYGLPDIGFTAWSDLVAFVQRLRPVLPRHHLLVDIDDGFGDAEVACHVVSLLEISGASGVVLEDQKRPRRCGHFSGKQLLDLDEYITKLERVLRERREMVVIARTDASDPADIRRRVAAMQRAGPDAILVDGIRDFELLASLSDEFKLPFAFNQIAGGKSPPVNQSELERYGASLIIYSTPCLFAAQTAIESTMQWIKGANGSLPPAESGGDMKSCVKILGENLDRRVTR